MMTVPRSAAASGAASGLLGFVRGPSQDGATRAMAAQAVPGTFFSYPDGLTPREHQALTYERLRVAGRCAPPDAGELAAAIELPPEITAPGAFVPGVWERAPGDRGL